MLELLGKELLTDVVAVERMAWDCLEIANREWDVV